MLQIKIISFWQKKIFFSLEYAKANNFPSQLNEVFLELRKENFCILARERKEGKSIFQSLPIQPEYFIFSPSHPASPLARKTFHFVYIFIHKPLSFCLRVRVVVAATLEGIASICFLFLSRSAIFQLSKLNFWYFPSLSLSLPTHHHQNISMQSIMKLSKILGVKSK
jgi:hypothetical protein